MRFAIYLIFGLLANAALFAQDRLNAPTRVGVGMTRRELTLQQAVELALHNNLEIEIEKTNVDTSFQAVKAAQGVFDPGFRYLPAVQELNTPTGSILQGSSGKLTDKSLANNFYLRDRVEKTGTSLELDFTNARQSTTNPFSSFNPQLTSGLQILVTQPLLRNRDTDRDRTEIRVRQKSAQIAQVDFELKIIDIVARVEQAYWDLVGARQDERVEADAVELARQQLGINKRLVNAGTLAPIELAASEADLQRRLDTYFTSLENITRTENTLKSLDAGGAGDTIWTDEILPADDKPLSPPMVDELSEAVSQAIRRRPELRRVGIQNESNDLQRALGETLRKPQIDLVGSYTLNGLGGTVISGPNPFTASNLALYTQLNQIAVASGIAPLPLPSGGAPPPFLVGSYGTALGNLFGGRYQSFQAGLTLDLNLRNRTAIAQLTQASIQEKKLKLQRIQTQQDVQVQIRNALQSIETAKQRVTAADASERAAKEKLDSESRLFQNGESTNFLVLTRQNDFADARRRAVQASLDFNKSISRLEQALGTTLQTYKIVLP